MHALKMPRENGDPGSPPVTPPASSPVGQPGDRSSTGSGKTQIKKKPEDFIFGKVIGEGSYSTVLLAREVSTEKEYAIKVLEKRHIIQEKKQEYVMREKEVFSRLNHPFFVKLYFTFQDVNRLYFGLSYCCRGELLEYIDKLGCFDLNCTRFYSAEITLALDHLHSLGIIHRDLKPENILLNEDMHIQITDFGSAKILNKPDNNTKAENKRRNSFVGTAQYVSPEVLNSKDSYLSSDLWALGCIIYQLCSGKVPFYGGNEYAIFQKIIKLEYVFPDGFDPGAKDLVQSLLVLNPTKRLGCEAMGGYSPLKSHRFFKGIKWSTLPEESPPELLPYLPATGSDSENLWSKHTPGLDDQHLSRLQLTGIDDQLAVDIPVESNEKPKKTDWFTKEERERRIQQQAADNEYHRFVESNLVLKQGLLDKRVGLFSRRRMMLLTEGPHIYYVDPQAMVLKGEIPWSKQMRTEAKNFKIFFVHTPNRTYYLEDPTGNALKWCKKIEEVWSHYYSDEENSKAS